MSINHQLASFISKSAEVLDAQFIQWDSNSMHLARIGTFDQGLQPLQDHMCQYLGCPAAGVSRAL